MPAIQITGCNPANGTLTLSDNGSTNANRGQVVTWTVKSGVNATVTNIYNKSTSVDVFSPDPAKVGASANWQGTVNSSISVPAEEDYNIDWTDASGNPHTYDPKIRVQM